MSKNRSVLHISLLHYTPIKYFDTHSYFSRQINKYKANKR